MSGFTPAERVEVDRQYKVLARALHALSPEHPIRLKSVLQGAESGTTDPTLARVLVAGEIYRGVTWEGRSPLTVRGFAMSAELATALAEAEKLGRSISAFALGNRRKGLLRLLAPRKSFSQSGKEALMRCRAIGAAQERRQSGASSPRLRKA